MRRHLLTILSMIMLSFSIHGQVTSVGLIGSATPGGWDTDTDMTVDPVHSDVWTMSITLNNGEVKFRANDDWVINWGGPTFPEGTGTQDGPNIKVLSGEYFVTFNSTTGEYNFDVQSDIGLIGSATPGGWETDTDMYIDSEDSTHYYLPISLIAGEAKFRKDDAWTVNWGANSFPTGTGTQDGPNIPVPAGDYIVHFNKTTGDYEFEVPFTGYNSIGVIGSATPGGWDTDTDLTQDANNKDFWKGFVDLVVGELKFRADDDWADDWGGTDFPNGVAVYKGPNLPIATAGRYLITFNSATLEYSFTEIKPFTTIGLIGTAQGGWETDTDMVQDGTNPELWSLETNLVDGEAKFRAEDAWTVNWGAKDFPAGTGIQDGPNIPIIAGKYTVTFNSGSGDYLFQIHSNLGIIGSATPKGWDADVDLFQDKVDTNKYFTTMNLKSGEAKFRLNNEWTINWGAADFPTGTGTQDGPNIPIAQAGKYYITFDKSTGAYSFTEIVAYESIGVVGTAQGSWDTDTDLIRDGNNGDLWKARIDLVVGEAKFRANDAWVYNWGGTDFPSGTAVKDGPNIQIPEDGKYQVTFNSRTLAYSFSIIKPFEKIGIIGSATPGGWDTDTDMERDANDPTIWKLRIKLIEGELKFRANDDWTVNWGSGDFPKGIGEQDGANIPISAGDYKITFNTLTGEYEFIAVVEFGKISLVGQSGPFGEWPGSDDSKDTYLTKDPNDPNHWTLSSVELTEYNASTSNGIKFRAEASWAINWGAVDFPHGIGVQNGPNIECKAGTYSIDFRSDTGEYLFGDPGSIEALKDPNAITILPNPASTAMTLRFESEKLAGQIKYSLLDITGKQVLKGSAFTSSEMTLDLTNVQTGTYMLYLSNENYFLAKKVSVVK